jgi:hypothetical protein
MRISVTKIKTRTRTPPADEIKSHQHSGRPLSQRIHGAKPHLKNPDNPSVIVDERGATGAFSAEHLDREKWCAATLATPNDLALIQAQPISERVTNG